MPNNFKQARTWAWIFGLSLLWTFFLVVRGSPVLTLVYKWNDHLSNISTSKVFFEKGVRVFDTPKENLVRRWPKEKPLPEGFRNLLPETEPMYEKDGQPYFFVWPYIPNPYPPGAYFYFYPFSFITYDLGLGFYAGALGFIFVTLVLAHICFVLLIRPFWARREEFRGRWQKGIFYLSTFLLYCELCQWPMNGQYETVALPFLILAVLAAHQRRYAGALAFYGIALFLHPRALFFLPFVPWLLWQWFRSPKAWLKDLTFLAISFLGAMSLAVGLYMSLSVHNDAAFFRNLNKWGMQALSEGPAWRAAIFAAVVVGYGIFLYRKRTWALLIFFLWTNFLFLQSAQVRPWYVTLLLPIFLLEKPTARNFLLAALTYFVMVQFSPMNSPTDFNFVKTVIESLWNPGLP